MKTCKSKQKQLFSLWEQVGRLSLQACTWLVLNLWSWGINLNSISAQHRWPCSIHLPACAPARTIDSNLTEAWPHPRPRLGSALRSHNCVPPFPHHLRPQYNFFKCCLSLLWPDVLAEPAHQPVVPKALYWMFSKPSGFLPRYRLVVPQVLPPPSPSAYCSGVSPAVKWFLPDFLVFPLLSDSSLRGLLSSFPWMILDWASLMC